MSSFIFDWDSLHARLNSHYKAWNYKEKKHKNIKAYKKSVKKEATIKRCTFILDLKPFRSYVKVKHSIGREFESSCARNEMVDLNILVISRNGNRKIMQLSEQRVDLPQE